MSTPPDFHSFHQRNTLRKQLRERRRALSPSQQAQAAQKLAIRLARHPWLQRAKTIAAYIPADGEISPLPLLQHLARQGKQTLLPCIEHQGGPMHFKPFDSATRWTVNAFGIAEPRYGQAYAAQALEVILLPLVGFDCEGNRLGMGGGFYDRTLTHIRQAPTRLIGLAHSVQQAQQVPAAAWDIPLHAVATEKQVFTFKRRR